MINRGGACDTFTMQCDNCSDMLRDYDGHEPRNRDCFNVTVLKYFAYEAGWWHDEYAEQDVCDLCVADMTY